MNYTKGEWKVMPHPLGKFIDIFGDTGMPIATIQHFSKDKTIDEANAQLIAAAPDMYEALRQVYDYLEGNIVGNDNSVKQFVGEVLNKAEGK